MHDASKVWLRERMMATAFSFEKVQDLDIPGSCKLLDGHMNMHSELPSADTLNQMATCIS